MIETHQKPNSIISAQHIYAAAARIRGIVRRTPLDESLELTGLTGANIHLKMECLQLTGSFKIRGATNVLARLHSERRLAGVIAPTAGNHGLGLAYAGRATGVPVTICLPYSADPVKASFIKAQGGRIEFFNDIESARQGALEIADKTGATFVSAYDHPDMIAGAGTIGLELLEDSPDLDVILVCIGGGSLASGIATIAKAINPTIEVWGIQSEESPTFARWKDAGHQTTVELSPSIAEGISGFIEPGTMTWPIVRERVDRVLTVSETEIKMALLTMLNYHCQVVEPSGIAAVAGAIRYATELKGRKVGIVVTGRNVSGNRYRCLLDEVANIAPGRS